MANFELLYKPSTEEWFHPETATTPLYTGKYFELTFDQGDHSGTTYTTASIKVDTVWRRCGRADDLTEVQSIGMPSEGSSNLTSFCCNGACFQKGDEWIMEGKWHDPKLKLRNKDSTGSPASSPPTAGNCTCV